MPSAGISLGSAAFYVEHPVFGALCFLCNVISTDVSASGGAGVSFQPVDGYRRRVYLEPLGLNLVLDSGTFATVTLDMDGKKCTLVFTPLSSESAAFKTRRLRVDKMAESRPGAAFTVGPTVYPYSRGAFEIPTADESVVLRWK